MAQPPSRKRTASFSCPPAKAARMAASLRRTESCVDLRPIQQRRLRSLRQPTQHVHRPQPLPPPRLSSPLAPSRSPRPSRPLFPRSKPEPDLYRKALTTSMKGSPEGQKILRMGPRVALSMMNAMLDLERLVASAAGDDADAEGDVHMHDATTLDDWEMVDCAV